MSDLTIDQLEANVRAAYERRETEYRTNGGYRANHDIATGMMGLVSFHLHGLRIAERQAVALERIAAALEYTAYPKAGTEAVKNG